MKTRILILITVIAVGLFGTVTATAQGKAIYFMKDGNVTYSSEIANIDSIIFVPRILSVEPFELSFTAEATESYDVVVTTNQQSWDATSDQTWCTITKETNQFTVSATANTTATKRTATITVTAGNATPKTILVTQAGFNLADEISMGGIRIVYQWYGSLLASFNLYCTLTVKNYSGTLPLSCNVGTKTWNGTINVQANTSYNINFAAGGSSSPNISYSYPIKISVGNVLEKTATTDYIYYNVRSIEFLSTKF